MTMLSHAQCPETKQKGREHQRLRVLFAVTGSVAAVKGPEIAVRLVNELDAVVRVLLTRGGENFWTKAKDYNPQYWDQMQELQRNGTRHGIDGDSDVSISICCADDEWKGWQKIGDSVLHIDLRDWADVLLVAPLSAHTLAKFSQGFCDDTLSCVFRAWDFGHGSRPGKPLLLAPAMNTAMWQHPLTQTQLSTIRGFWKNTYLDGLNVSNGRGIEWKTSGVRIIDPQVKTLACGEIGNGALASTDTILEELAEVITHLAKYCGDS